MFLENHCQTSQLMVLANTVPTIGKLAKTPGKPSQARIASNWLRGISTIIGIAKDANSAVLAPTSG